MRRAIRPRSVSRAAAVLVPAVASLLTSMALAPVAAAQPTTPPGKLAEQAPPMTIEQLAGQHVIYSYKGLVPPPELLDEIRAGEVGGVIFFSDNISSPQQLAGVSAELQKAAMASPLHLPLLLTTDQEGGQVRRIEPGGPTQSEKQIGQSSDPAAAAAEAGQQAAQTLKGAGNNTNLGPVLGVYRQPGDFLDNHQRSYSSDPKVVATAGASFIDAQQKAGVAATAKHFPGLGAAATEANTDERPVTIDTPAAEIRNVDEAPYRDAIAHGVDLVMTSWAVYPSLDAKLPAGLSPTIVQGELRQRLGYQGVIMTDAIEAGALKAFGDYGHRGVLASQAGTDLLLASGQSMAEGDQVRTALARAISAGQVNPIQLAGSTVRVLALRNGFAR